MSVATQTPVCLTQSVPFNIDSEHLVFYDVIGPSITRRSSVLSGLLEADGEARLPDDISLENFRAYLRAAQDREYSFHELSFASMCSIIQVADILGDVGVEEWIKAAANQLRKYFCPDSPVAASTKETEEIARILSCLRGDLSSRIIKGALPSQESVAKALSVLPTPFHAAALEAVISPAKALELPFTLNMQPQAIMRALGELPASPAAVTSLQVQYNVASQHERIGREEARPIFQKACQNLASALRHHSSLHTLDLQGLMLAKPSAARVLMPAVASMPALQHLSIAAEISQSSTEETNEACPLRRMLQALPGLKSLSIVLNLPLNRRKQAHRSHPRCITSIVSVLSALTSLKLKSDAKLEFLTIKSPLHFPSLVDLTLETTFLMAAAFMDNLSAPLTSLELDQEIQLKPEGSSAVKACMGGISRCTRLQRLQLSVPTDVKGSKENPVQRAALSAVPPALTKLQQLMALHVCGDVIVLHGIVEEVARACALHYATADAPPLLARLAITVRPGPGVDRQSERQAGSAGLPRSLAMMTHLQHLEFSYAEVNWDSFGLSALAPLAHLTALTGRNWQCFQRAQDAAALGAMTRLQHLQLDHDMRMYEIGSLMTLDGLEEALGQLRQLTYLSFQGDDLCYAVNEAVLGSEDVQEAWSGLRELRMSLVGDDAINEFLSDTVSTGQCLSALQVLNIDVYVKYRRHRDHVPIWKIQELKEDWWGAGFDLQIREVLPECV